MKISVVLADDEPLILKGLSKLIPWEEYGMEIVAYAYDGKELLESIETYKPDIVISDISMPHMSGIDIIKQIKQRQLPIKVIFISAYQEFSYARDAVAFGAVDYLVKPIKKSQLEEVVLHTISLIREENEEEALRNKLHLLERMNRNDEVDGWLEQLTEGTLSVQSDGYLYLTEHLTGPLYTVAVVSIDPIGNDNNRWPAQTQKLVEFAIRNIVEESLMTYGKGFSFTKSGKQVLAVGHDSAEEPFELATVIKNNIAHFLKLKVSIGIGEPVRDMLYLRNSRMQAEQALGMTYFAGLNRVIKYRKQEPLKDRENELFTIQSDIVRALTAGDWEKSLSMMKSLIRVIEAATVGNRQLAISTCFSSLLYIVQEVKNAEVPMSEWGFDIVHLQSRLGQYETYEMMCSCVYDMLQELFDRIGDRQGLKEKTLIARIVHHIEEHYMEDISLESVAAVAFMSPNYFSSFFKKHVKRNFKQYIIDLRMEHAISLFMNTDMKVYEIAEKVGYHNARHFSDMFKKQTGTLPQEYRNSLKS